MKYIKLFESFEEEKLDIPYNFVEEVKDLLVEYEDQNLDVYFGIRSYINSYTLYLYEYSRNEIKNDIYSPIMIDHALKSYQKNKISLNKFVYFINIDDNKELSIKFVNRLKQIYPNINTDISNYDVKWELNKPNYRLNDKSKYTIYFILD